MWIKRSEVLEYVNQYLHDIKLEELFLLSKSIKIDVNKKTIEEQILKISNGEVVSKIDYYDKFVKALKIYSHKSFQICFILKMIAGEVTYSQGSVDALDLTIDDEKILKSDVDRLVIPLKHIYKEIIVLKQKAENFSTYLDEIDFSMPKTGVVNFSSNKRLDEVKMTRRQVQDKLKQREEIRRKIIEKYNSTHNIQID